MTANPDARLFKFCQPVENAIGYHNPHGDFDGANESMCKIVGEKLAAVYPGRPWAVFSEIEHGIVKVAVQGFLQWPYVIHVSTMKCDPAMRAVVKAGGELLERLGMGRARFQIADWQKANMLRPYTFNRNTSAPEGL